MKLRDGWEVVSRCIEYHNKTLNAEIREHDKETFESIVNVYDESYGGRFFKTLTAAMEDAEKRAEK